MEQEYGTLPESSNDIELYIKIKILFIEEGQQLDLKKNQARLKKERNKLNNNQVRKNIKLIYVNRTNKVPQDLSRNNSFYKSVKVKLK